MIIKTSCILAALTLTACASDRHQGDWANDCERNSSENASALVDCKAATAKNKAMGDSKAPGVGLTDAGPKGGEFDMGDKEKDGAHVD